MEASRVAISSRLSSEAVDCNRVTAQAKELAHIYQAQVAQVRGHTIGHARSKYVGKCQSCMVNTKMYQAQVAQMDEMLQKESVRAQELQEQLLELEVAKNNGELRAQAELADLARRVSLPPLALTRQCIAMHDWYLPTFF